MQSRGRLVATTVSVGFLAVSVSIAHVVARHSQLAAIVCGLLGLSPVSLSRCAGLDSGGSCCPPGSFWSRRSGRSSSRASAPRPPFMTYRQVSSGTQSVPLGTALQASIVGLIALLCLVLVGLLVRKSVPVALSAGIAVTWLILTKTSSSGARVRSRIGSGSTLTSTFWVSPPSCLPTMRDLLSQPWIGILKKPRPAGPTLCVLTTAGAVALAAAFGWLSVPDVLAQRRFIEPEPACRLRRHCSRHLRTRPSTRTE